MGDEAFSPALRPLADVGDYGGVTLQGRGVGFSASRMSDGETLAARAAVGTIRSAHGTGAVGWNVRATRGATEMNQEPANRDLPPGLRLRDGERVLLAFRPSPGWVVLINKIVTLWLYTIWWKRTGFILTDQRVIYKRGVLNATERSLPLRFVQDATVVSKWYGVAGVRVSTAGGADGFEQLSPLSVGNARRFKDALLDAAQATWPSQAAV